MLRQAELIVSLGSRATREMKGWWLERRSAKKAEARTEREMVREREFGVATRERKEEGRKLEKGEM